MGHQDSQMKESESAVEIVERLILSRQFFYHGVEHSIKQGRFERMIAINNLHLSIEMVIRTIAYKYGLNVWPPDIGITSLVREIKKAKGEIKDKGLVLPYIEQINNLIKWRNLTVHGGKEPNEEQIQEFTTLTERFLRETTRTFFGEDFDALSAVQLIKNAEVRDLLLRAERHIQQVELLAGEDYSPGEEPKAYNDYQQSLAILAVTFGLAYEQLKDMIPRAVLERLMVPPALSFEDDQDSLATIWDRLREQEVASLCNILGIDYWILQELIELVPTIIVDENDICSIRSQNEWAWEEDPLLLRRLLGFEVELLIDWQSRSWLHEKLSVGALDAYSSAARKLLKGEDLPDRDYARIARATSEIDLGPAIMRGFPFLPSSDMKL